MNLKDFIKMYLPDFKKRHREAYIQNARSDKTHSIVEAEFAIFYFQEAFSNYEKQRKEELKRIVEKACEIQRKICFKAYNEYWSDKAILNAKQPKLEEI